MIKKEVYLSIGSNMGNRSANCREALIKLGEVDGITLEAISSLYETRPVGYEDQPCFINMAAKIETSLSPEELLIELKKIEKLIGRVKSFRWGPRVIDMDILFYADEIIDTPGLTVPHPLMEQRAFVIIPLAEIGAELVHPQSGRRVADLRNALAGDEGVTKLDRDII